VGKMLYILLSIINGWYNRPIGGRSTDGLIVTPPQEKQKSAV
jgi:hypothetical protein